MKKIISCCVCSLLVYASNAQHTHEEPFRPHWRGSIVMANSHIPLAAQGEKKLTVIPTWGLDIGYKFHPRWSIGLQNDIKLQNFEVEQEGEVALERNYPISTSLIGYFDVLKHWTVFTGPGIEFEKSENLMILKFGVEYVYEVNEKFEIEVGLIYERRESLYDGYTFAVAFTKPFRPKKTGKQVE